MAEKDICINLSINQRRQQTFYGLLPSVLSILTDKLFFIVFHAFTQFVFNVGFSVVEFTNTFAYSAHEFGDFVTAEKQKDNAENEENLLATESEY
jgi:hypothetical protein